jgi:hypothetical protein
MTTPPQRNRSISSTSAGFALPPTAKPPTPSRAQPPTTTVTAGAKRKAENASQQPQPQPQPYHASVFRDAKRPKPMGPATTTTTTTASGGEEADESGGGTEFAGRPVRVLGGFSNQQQPQKQTKPPPPQSRGRSGFVAAGRTQPAMRTPPITPTDARRFLASRSGAGGGGGGDPSSDPAEAIQGVVCQCGNPVRTNVTRKPGNNFGKRFYSCAHWPNEELNCGYFKWHDDLVLSMNDTHAPATKEVIVHNRVFAEGMRCAGDVAADFALDEKRLAVARFAAAARARGWTVNTASEIAETYEHYDLRATRGACDAEEMRVNVQPLPNPELMVSMLSLLADAERGETGREAMSEILCLLTHAAQRDERGWIVDGRADVVAFETSDGSFLLLDRKALWRFVVGATGVDPPRRLHPSSPPRADGRYPRLAVFDDPQWCEQVVLASVNALLAWGEAEEREPPERPMLVDRWTPKEEEEGEEEKGKGATATTEESECLEVDTPVTP